MFKQLSQENKKLFLQSYLAFFINGLLGLSLGAMLPYLSDSYHLNYGLAGALLSINSIGNLVSSFLAGVLPLHLGRRRAAVLMSALGVAGYLLMLCGPSPAVLMLGFCLVGLCRGSCSNVSNTVSSAAAPGQAWALNLLHAVFAVGAFTFPFLFVAFTSINSECWRLGCWFMAAAILVQTLIYSRMKMPDEHPVNQKKGGGWGFLRDVRFLLACGILFTYMCLEQGVCNWLVTYFQDSGLLSSAMAQTMASLLWLAILAGRLFCAWLTTRMRKSLMLCFNAVGYMIGFVCLMRSTAPTAIVVCILLLGFCMAGLYPTTVSMVGPISGRYPLAMSVLLTVAGCGSIVMPSIIGAVAEVKGITGGMATLWVAVAATVTLIFVSGWVRRHDAE